MPSCASWGALAIKSTCLEAQRRLLQPGSEKDNISNAALSVNDQSALGLGAIGPCGVLTTCGGCAPNECRRGNGDNASRGPFVPPDLDLAALAQGRARRIFRERLARSMGGFAEIRERG